MQCWAGAANKLKHAFPCICLCSLMLAWTDGAAMAGQLLPANQNPVQAGVQVDSFVTRALEIFDATPSSRRHYDHVEPLDGVTVGLGHYPQAELKQFFESLRRDQAAHAAFVQRATEYFSANRSAFNSARMRLRLPSAQPSAQTVSELLEASLFSSNYMNRYRKNCRIKCTSREANFFAEHRS